MSFEVKSISSPSPPELMLLMSSYSSSPLLSSVLLSMNLAALLVRLSVGFVVTVFFVAFEIKINSFFFSSFLLLLLLLWMPFWLF